MVNQIQPINPFVEFTKEAIEQSIPARFEQQVERYPNRLAVRTKSHELTYMALNQIANRVAQAILAQRGSGAEPIALLADPSAMTIAGILGILKAGKIWVPIDPSFPSARLSQILADIAAALIVTDDPSLALASELSRGCPLLNLDQLDPDLPSENPNLFISPDTLAYILYTSGSTGQPKGVMQNHRHVLHNIRSHTNTLRIYPDDRLSLLTSYTHLSGATATFRALLNGAALLPFYLKKEGVAHLADWLRQEEITLYQSVPTVFRYLLDTLNGDETFPKLRLIHLGGEPVSTRDVELYKKHFAPTCILLHNLGSTETSTIRQYFIGKDTPIHSNVVPVGYEVEDKALLLLDEAGQEVAPGEVGEIVVKSRYLSPGYWNRPDLSQAVSQPTLDGEWLYHTGDIGRMLPGNCLVHLGRKDLQVKIRGSRVELTEVETALLGHPGVKEAAVSASANSHGDQQLVAYFVPRPGQPPTVPAVRAFLQDRLPSYMVPTAFVTLESLPLTSAGKVDRRALPAPNPVSATATVSFAAPNTTLEHKLACIWADVLKLEQVGLYDNFFDLGGHSLLAMRLLTQVKQQLGYDLPPTALFQAPTIEQMANLLNRDEAAPSWSALIALQPNGSKPPFFCLPGNLGNVFTDLSHLARTFNPDQPFYALQDSPHNPARIKDLAALYLSEIRAFQPQGPYFLGGICAGGLVAFEMAQQLHQQKQTVALLALIEPAPPRGPGLRSYVGMASLTFRRIVRRFGHHSNTVTQLDATQQKIYAQYKLKLLANSWALRNYAPQPYPGSLHLFLTHESLRDARNPQLDWRKFAAHGTQMHELSGTHDTITGNNDTPIEAAYMQVLAKQLRRCLEAAEVGIVTLPIPAGLKPQYQAIANHA